MFKTSLTGFSGINYSFNISGNSRNSKDVTDAGYRYIVNPNYNEGGESPEDSVNFFGKSDDKIFHDKFEEQLKLFGDTKGDGIFRVYGHGDTGMIFNGNKEIKTAADFDIEMGKKNTNWKKVDNYKNPMLILYSCESAYEEEPNGRFSSFAKKVSIRHPNVTVVGFDGYVDYGQKGMSRINEHLHTGDGNGKIVIYKNGVIIHKGLFKNF